MQLNSIALQCGVSIEPKFEYKGEYAFATFGVANTRGFGDKAKTNYFNVKVWGKQAEFVRDYITKGSQVCIQGELEYSKGKDDKVYISIVAREIDFTLGNKKKEDGSTPPKAKEDSPPPEIFSDDDIPF